MTNRVISRMAVSAAALIAGMATAVPAAQALTPDGNRTCVTNISVDTARVISDIEFNRVRVTGDPANAVRSPAVTDVNFLVDPFIGSNFLTKDVGTAVANEILGDADISLSTANFVRNLPDATRVVEDINLQRLSVVTGINASDGGASATGANSFACGPNATASGSQSTALGDNANATALSSTAVGQDSRAEAINATAVGEDARALAAQATAVGQGAIVLNENGTAIGENAFVNANNGTALGQGATATALNATAIGQSASASGLSSLAIGQDADANMEEATAVGANSVAGFHSTAVGQLANAQATGATAIGWESSANTLGTAVGNSARANGANSTAVGRGTQANGAGSTAIGRDSSGNAAVASLENQFVLGTANHTYTTPGITSGLSRARQSGPLEVVTSDGAGNLATDGGDIFKSLSELGAGVAIATALENPDLVGGETFGMAANIGVFEGSSAIGISAIGVLGQNFMGGGERWAVSGGFGVSLDEEGYGGNDEERVVSGRGGVQVTW